MFTIAFDNADVMYFEFTPGAARALEMAERLARQARAALVEPGHLLWALVLDESRAAEIVSGRGLSRYELERVFPLPSEAAANATEADEIGPSDRLQAVLVEASKSAAFSPAGTEIGSEHLLCGLAVVPSDVQELLHSHGLAVDALRRLLTDEDGAPAEPLAAEIRLSLPDTTEEETTDGLRIIDAAANRAREGVRVVEDFVRFTLDDRHLMSLLKSWRHRLSEALSRLDPQGLLSSRDTRADVGTSVSTGREALRESPRNVAIVNFKRAQEALRTLEEFGKLLSADLGRRCEALRYELYTLEKAVLTTHAARERLEGRNVYLLVTSSLCPNGPGPVITAALAAGAGVIQVREKKMSDRELLTYARHVREWTSRAGALFIMNDRPDLAVLCGADGVHVGQEELTVREARRVVGPARLVGVSTHTIEQARQAVLDGADYIGVGPVFSSTTKAFEQLAGLAFVRQIAAEVQLPAFAISGITLENVDQVLAAGACRVALSSAICGAPDPGEAVAEFRRRIEGE